MHIPTHIITAAVVCNTVLYLDKKTLVQGDSTTRSLKVGILCVLLSLLSHLLLDAIPHNNGGYALFNLYMFPFLLRFPLRFLVMSLFLVPVSLFFLYLTRDHEVLALLSLIGEIYPDAEKALYLYKSLPRFLVLFPGHSYAYSPNGWESDYKWTLIGLELCLFMMLARGVVWIVQCRTPQYPKFSCTLLFNLGTSMSESTFTLKLSRGRFNMLLGQSKE